MKPSPAFGRNQRNASLRGDFLALELAGAIGLEKMGVTPDILMRTLQIFTEHRSHAVQSFLARHTSKIKGVLNGFDRIRFRGTLRWLSYTQGLMKWLSRRSVLLKSFKEYALSMTDEIREQTKRLAEAAQCPVIYLQSSSHSKEDLAQRIAASNGVREGLVCVLTCVEQCQTFTVGPSAQTKHLELRPHKGKCLHQYFYYLHPDWGWSHLRLQTWLPFNIHVVINGRDWLARQLQQAGVAYEKRDNCFVNVADPERAQQLLTSQLQTNWGQSLDHFRQLVHPAHERMFGDPPLPHYYWSADETEWATDVMFRSGTDLAGIYPALVRHGIMTFGSQDVLRFLGRRSRVEHFSKQAIHSQLKSRPEGTRIRHQMGHNSIKMYDKQESILRVETTINDARGIKSYRSPEGDPDGPKQWRMLRKGVADLPRRAQVSQAANTRYLEALSTVDHAESLQMTTASLSRPTAWKGRRVRALNPMSSEDSRLLQAVSRAEFHIHGFGNRDLRPLLFDHTASSTTWEGHRQSAKVTRLLRLLRGHKLISKINRSHRYRLTKQGRIQITALLAAQQANTTKLTELAA